MKKVFLCLFILLFMNITSHGEEPVLFDKVYVDNKADPGHYSDIPTALLNVKEGGTIYIGKVINISSSFQITKSVKIESLNRQSYPLQINASINRVFYLDNIPKFTLNNIFIRGSSVDVIKGIAEDIIIQNSSFESCNPINITANRGYNFLLEDNTFYRARVNIQPLEGNNHVTLINNTFSMPVGGNESLILKNSNINVSENTFERYSFILENGAEIQGNISDNTFGVGAKILIKNQGEFIHFNNNKILSTVANMVTYNGSSNPDFQKNWWGSKDGPGQNMIWGVIDYSRWALDMDFTSFYGDPDPEEPDPEEPDSEDPDPEDPDPEDPDPEDPDPEYPDPEDPELEDPAPEEQGSENSVNQKPAERTSRERQEEIILNVENVNSGDNIFMEEMLIPTIEDEKLRLISKIYRLTTHTNQLQDITIPFTGEGLDEDSLGVYYLNREREKWLYLGGLVDREALTITVTTIQDTLFGVFTQEGKKLSMDMEGHWSRDYIKRLYMIDLMCGYEDKSFQPDKLINRVEIAVLLTKVMNSTFSQEDSFTDNYAIPSWARDSVYSVTEQGLFKGYEDDTFRPKRNITRAELMCAIGNMLPPNENQLNYEDKGDIPDWAFEGIEKCSAYGIVNGDDQGFIRPKDFITRAEAATMIYQLLKVLKI